jgi:hypothetical protein
MRQDSGSLTSTKMSYALQIKREGNHLEKLDLLMLAKHKFRSFAPVRRVLPTMLNEARRMAIDLDNDS